MPNGIGYVVHFGKHRVESDFGPGGRHDGFTAFYLRRHVRLNKTMRRRFGDVDVYEGIAPLERAGLVFCPARDPTPHLMYLTTQGKARAAQSR